MLSLDVVKQLRSYLPAKDEIDLIREWREQNEAKPPEEQRELPQAEMFMDIVNGIPMVADRLQVCCRGGIDTERMR